MGGFALAWWLTQESGGSATVLATASLVALLPGVLLGPIVGALVDRWSRKRVMVVADSLVAVFSAIPAVLAWTVTPGVAYLRDHVRPALGGIFHFAAMQAATSLMVPKTELARVVGYEPNAPGGALHYHAAAGGTGDERDAAGRDYGHRRGDGAFRCRAPFLCGGA